MCRRQAFSIMVTCKVLSQRDLLERRRVFPQEAAVKQNAVLFHCRSVGKRGQLASERAM